MSPEERLMLEREGAKFARQYQQAAQGLLGLLAQYNSSPSAPSEESLVAIVSVFTGYLGVMFDEMPEIDMDAATRQAFSTWAVGAPPEVRDMIAKRVVDSLKKRRETMGPTTPMGAS